VAGAQRALVLLAASSLFLAALVLAWERGRRKHGAQAVRTRLAGYPSTVADEAEEWLRRAANKG
jgi:hypothetical protein